MRILTFCVSLILIFMIPWEDAFSVAQVGSLARAGGLALAAAWLGTVLVTGRFRKPHPFHFVMFLFILWNLCSVLWSASVDSTLEHITTYLQLAGLAFILWDLYSTEAALKAGLQAYVLGAYVAVGSTALNYFTGQEAFAYSGGRYTGAGLNANDLALILALGLPIAWHLATSAGSGIQSRILTLINYAYIPAALFAILLTGSRMSIFAVVPAALYILGTAHRLKPFARITISLALIGAFFILQPYIPQAAVSRLASTSSSIAESDLGGRVTIWRECLLVFSKHPFLGVGAGALGTVIEARAVAHNTFLSVLTELGLVGFVLFASMLATVLFQALRQTKWHAGLWLTLLAIWVIGVVTLTWEYRKPTWLLLSLVVASASLYDADRQESAAPAGYPTKRFDLRHA